MNKKNLYDMFSALTPSGDIKEKMLKNILSKKNKKEKTPVILVASAITSVAAVCAACVLFVPQLINQTPLPVETDFSSVINTEKSDDAVIIDDEFVNTFYTNTFLKSVTATKTSGHLIETNTEFLLETEKDIEADELKTLLSLEPEIAFNIEKTAPCSFTLESSNDFPSGSIVKLSLNDGMKNWAFQTTDVFKITSVLPYDKTEYVPIYTGIEISFSQITEASDVEDYFEITPNVSGYFERHRLTVVFVPDDVLKYETVYTVKIKAGLPSADGSAIEEDYSFKFKTEIFDSNVYCYKTRDKISETFLPGDRTVVELYCSEKLFDKPFSLKLYQYGSAESYKNALLSYKDNSTWGEKYILPTGSLSEIFQSNEIPMRKENSNNWAPSFVMLPENLEEGYYLADITAKYNDYEIHIQHLIQINPVSVYAGILPNQAAFFINDAVTGNAAEKAAILLEINEKTLSAETDQDGIASLNLSEKEYGTGLLKIEYGDYLYLDLFDYQAQRERDPKEDYYLYLYSDREAYLSTDTIHVWGMARPRGNVPVPSDLYLSFGYDNTIGEDVPITLNPDGTFEAEIKIEKHAQAYNIPLKLMSGEKILCEKYPDILDYIKPIYTFETKLPVFTWQDIPAKADITAAFFDGTPAHGLNFEVGGNSIVTNSDGKASTEIRGEGSDTWIPQYTSVNFQLTGIENDYQSKYDNYYTLSRDVMIETEYNQKENTGSLVVKTSAVDTSRIKRKEDFDGNNHDLLRGEPVDISVKGDLWREWYEKIETGSYYNFIQKKNIKTYEYQFREEYIGTYEINTVGGEDVFENLPVGKEDSTYRFILNWKDTKGRNVSETVYLTRYMYPYRTDYHDYTLKADKNSFTENGELSFELLDKREPVKDTSGRIFYTFTSSEFTSYNISNSTNFKHIMTAEYIPNVQLSGAFFDGKNVYPIIINYFYAVNYSFDPTERSIELEITDSEEKYAPGENVNVNITARDKSDNPVVGATVSISVVDEAAFAVKDQKANVLESIYSDIFFPVVTQYYSYVQHTLEPYGAEKGGGGGDGGIRSDFKDTAAFMTGITDQNGNVSFNFSLPDNLTTWRATVQAVSGIDVEKQLAGTLTAPIVVTKPFFVTTLMLPKYITGDDITVSARCNGTVSDNVEITARIRDESGEIDKTITAKSGKAFEFGKLPKGKYKILFSASDGGNSDALELPLEVVDTILEVPVSKTFDLANGLPDIEPTRYPVSLYFYDNRYKKYGDILNKLYCSIGERADFRIARAFAQIKLGQGSEEESLDLLSDLAMDGVFKLLPYSYPDYDLTALICAAMPEAVNTDLTAKMLYEQLQRKEASSTTVTSCYMGLAALSKPVLTEIIDLLENPGGLTYTDKLRLCAALALIGDFESAEKFYNELSADIDGQNNDEKIQNTSVALITASILNLPEADGMAEYLLNCNSNEQTFVLELMTYLRYYKPKIEGEAVFSCNLDGKTETVKLERFYGKTLNFGREQLESADFKILSGGINCTLYYIGEINEQEKEPVINVKKSVKMLNDESPVPGKIMEVTLTVEGAGRNCLIEDVIPSGARYAGTLYENQGASMYYVSSNGQHVSVAMSNTTTTAKYYIRLVTAGEYVLEGAVARDLNGNWGVSERSMVAIEK